MAYKYKYKTPSKKRYRKTYRKRRSSYRKGVRTYKKGHILKFIQNNKQSIPDMYMTKLTYCDWASIASSGTSTTYDLTLRGNGVYDPEYSWGGHGASGFTELAGIYSQYRVYGSRIRVSIKANSDSTGTGDAVVLLMPTRTGGAFSLSDQIERMGSPFSKYGHINRGVNGNQPLFLQCYRSTKNIFGESDIDDDVYAATTSANPSQEWFWHLVVSRADKAAGSAYPGFIVLIEITYYVRFERRSQMNAP